MLDKLINKLSPYKYLLLLISSVLLILSLTIPIDTFAYKFIYPLLTSFTILAGLLVVRTRENLRSRLIRYIGVGLIVLQFVNLFVAIPKFETILGALFVIFFISMSVRVYKDIYQAKDIDREILAAVFCGYIFIGFLASFLFIAIEGFAPGSFSGMVDTIGLFDNFLYFSFVTLLTIGYGDMVPITALTKTLVVVIGLIGNFYTVMVTAIVIGKFLMNYRPGSKEND